MDLVIFDAFNTLVTAHPGYRNTFLDGLTQAGLEPSLPLLAEFQAASEGIDHSTWSRSRDSYVAWAAETLRLAKQANQSEDARFAARIVPALEQMHQAPMVQMPGAEDCLARNAGIRAILLAASPDEDFAGEHARSLAAVAELLTAG